jgi:hypothetical protein
MDLYVQSPIRLHGVVFNYLSRGTALPLLLKGHEVNCTLSAAQGIFILGSPQTHNSIITS